MKTIYKKILLAGIIIFQLSSVFAKDEIHILVQNHAADSAYGLTHYYNIQMGDSLVMSGIADLSSLPFFIFPDSIRWYLGVTYIGTTFDSLTITVNQPGIYSCVGYVGIEPLPSDYNIILTVSAPTAINNIPEDNIIKIFPTIATSYLHIKNAGARIQSIEITTVDGRLIFRKNNVDMKDDTYQIPLDGLNNGMYFLNLYSDSKRTTQKFIKAD